MKRSSLKPSQIKQNMMDLKIPNIQKEKHNINNFYKILNICDRTKSSLYFIEGGG